MQEDSQGVAAEVKHQLPQADEGLVADLQRQAPQAGEGGVVDIQRGAAKGGNRLTKMQSYATFLLLLLTQCTILVDAGAGLCLQEGVEVGVCLQEGVGEVSKGFRQTLAAGLVLIND